MGEDDLMLLGYRCRGHLLFGLDGFDEIYHWFVGSLGWFIQFVFVARLLKKINRTPLCVSFHVYIMCICIMYIMLVLWYTIHMSILILIHVRVLFTISQGVTLLFGWLGSSAHFGSRRLRWNFFFKQLLEAGILSIDGLTRMDGWRW